MEQRRDPEPITILIAIAGVTGATFSAVNYWRSHHYKPLPQKIRRKLVGQLDLLSGEVRYLRADVEDLESIFSRAEYPEGRTLRLGNGALVTLDEFRRYEQIADRVFTRLKKLHKLALKVQGVAFELPFVDKQNQINSTGEALDRIDTLIRSRDYSVDKAWAELRAIVEELEAMIHQLNTDLGRE